MAAQKRRLFLTWPGSPAAMALSCAAGALLVATAASLAQSAPFTTRVSISSAGVEGKAMSLDAAISGSGSVVAFVSWADNLVSNDTNGASDIFVRDRASGVTKRVSVDSEGNQSNGASLAPSVSSDGRFVAFHSAATNLVAGDQNGKNDVFVHDRQTGQTSRVSVASDGSESDGDSEMPQLSADGRYVAFDSRATNLVAGDTNGTWDVFVHDRSTGVTTRVSVASDGSEGNDVSELAWISANGRYVAFHSHADNLVSGDTNGHWDAFVHDRETGETTRVSVASDGSEANGDSFLPSLSADGRFVAFFSRADNLVADDTNGSWDVFVHHRISGQTTRVSVATGGSEGNDHSGYPAISEDGRYVVFGSLATNLVAGDTNGVEDVFVHDRRTGYTERLSLSSAGAQADDTSESARLSADGRCVTFTSVATNLVSGDTNGVADIFLRERWPYAPWDVNGDGIVNSLDVARIGLHWQQTGPPGWIPEDVNRDGIVNSLDLAILGLHWLETIG